MGNRETTSSGTVHCRKPETGMPPRKAVNFQQILTWLMVEIIFGRAHYEIARGLGRSDRRAALAFGTAPQFFGLTLDARAVLAQLALARIFDRASAVSIHKLFSLALNKAGTFKHGTATEVRKTVQDAKASITILEPSVAAIQIRRNESIAHSDARPIIDPSGYLRDGRISYLQIDGMFYEIGAILNKFSLLYRGASVPLDLEGAKDYEQALDLLADAVANQRSRVT